jgi:menaquinone-dependent protoporphyrinogen oxidase
MHREISLSILFINVLLILAAGPLSPEADAAPRTPADLIEARCGDNATAAGNILVTYDTIHGSTAEVAAAIAAGLCEQGFSADTQWVGAVAGIDGYDAVVVGSAIYEFTWLPDAKAFLSANEKRLETLPVACFIVCSAMSQDTPENRAAIQKSFVDPVLEQYPGISPVSTGLFGGAVDFTTNQYTLFERIVLRILGRVLGFKDTADWRNWEAIDRWAAELAEQLGY